MSGSSKSPRREMYEAKFEKFKKNKEQWDYLDNQFWKSQTDFDKYTWGPDSYSIKAKSVKWDENDDENDKVAFKPKDINNSRDVYNPDYENTLMRESIKQHQDKMASLSKKDKITFSILKWIFNAI